MCASAWGSQSVTLAWDSSTDPNVTGYKIYYGVASRVYTNTVDVGTATTVTVSNLLEGATYYFAATAYNSVGLESDFSAEASYTVPGGAVNAPPTLNTISNVSINEDAGSQTVNLAGISSGASNEVQTLTITAVSSNTGLIPNPTVNYTSPNSTGTLSFAPVANANGTATITVTVNDGQATNNTITRTFTVTVVAGNDAPTLNTINNVTINEDAGLQALNLTGISAGANEVQTLTVTATSSNTGLIPNPTINYTSPNTTGTLSFTPVPNANGTATITVTVNDGQSTNNTVTRTFTVTVNAVNDTPTLNALSNLSISEDAGLQTVNLAGISTGASNEVQTLTVTASSSNTGLIPNPTVTYTSPGATGILGFTPAANASGSATITVTVNDGQTVNNTITRSFTVNVGTVNDAPTITTIPDQTIATNTSTAALQFTIGDAETSAANLTLRATSSVPTLIPTNNIVFGGSGANRTATLTPLPNQSGVATITITVSDGSATASTTFQLNVLGPPAPPAQFQIMATAGGSISNLTGGSFILGQTYSLMAVPDAGQEFAGWSGSTNTSSQTITVRLTTNLVLQANFIPSPASTPSVAAAGSYNGLFYEPNQVRQTSAGFLTMKVTTKGTYSGRLQLGAARYSISGLLDSQGRATNVITSKRNPTPLTVELKVGNTNQADRVVGRITDGNWVANLLGDRAVFSSKSNPSPQSGIYTLVLPGQNGNTAMPQGDGFGVVRVDLSGRVKFAGMLADGTKISQSAPVSQEGLWPLYVPVYKGQGLLMSWQAFANRANDDLHGELTWIKAPDAGTPYYAAGFTIEHQAIGSAYRAPARGSSQVLNLADGFLTFSGGDLPADFANAISLGAETKPVNLSSNELTLSFSTSAGTFKGKVTDPTTGESSSFCGAVLQKMNAGYGFLLGSNRSSRVALTP